MASPALLKAVTPYARIELGHWAQARIGDDTSNWITTEASFFAANPKPGVGSQRVKFRVDLQQRHPPGVLGYGLFETCESLVFVAQGGVSRCDQILGSLHSFGKGQPFVQRPEGIRSAGDRA